MRHVGKIRDETNKGINIRSFKVLRLYAPYGQPRRKLNDNVRKAAESKGIYSFFSFFLFILFVSTIEIDGQNNTWALHREVDRHK